MTTSSIRYWIWVFSKIEGLRWVLSESRMAFPKTLAPRLTKIQPGDRAILYTARAAYGNPTRDMSRLAGVAKVVGSVSLDKAVELFGRRFEMFVPIETELLLDEREGPDARDLIKKLEVVKKEHAWTAYLRNSPVEISRQDFLLLENAVKGWPRLG